MNKPVAWIAYDEFGDFMLEPTPDGDYPWQPLYTAPRELSDELPSPVLQEYFEKGYKCAMESLQLSDEEITEVLIEKGIWSKLKDGGLCAWQEDADLHEFAKAILKKASEK